MDWQLNSNISVLEVLWTFVTLIGVAVSCRNLSMVVEDNHVLKSHASFIKNGPRHTLAKGRIRSEAIKAGLMIGFVLIGIAAMTQPPQGGNPTNPAAVTLTIIFIAGALAIIVDSFLYDRDRDKIIDFYQRLPDDIHIQETREDIRHGRTRKY